LVFHPESIFLRIISQLCRVKWKSHKNRLFFYAAFLEGTVYLACKLSGRGFERALECARASFGYAIEPTPMKLNEN